MRETFAVQISGDVIDEEDEEFGATISIDLSEQATVQLMPAQTVVVITDDDSESLALAPAHPPSPSPSPSYIYIQPYR